MIRANKNPQSGDEMLQAVLLVLALSMDALVASISYGAQNIQIPLRSKLVLAAVGTSALGLSLLLGEGIQQFLPKAFYIGAGFSILFLMGVTNLFQNTLKHYLQNHQRKKITFGFADISFILDIYLDETRADRDDSKSLSAREAFALASALSLDSVFAGLGMGFSRFQGIAALVLCFLFHYLAVALGLLAGQKLSGKLLARLWWLGGVLLIVLAVMKLV